MGVNPSQTALPIPSSLSLSKQEIIAAGLGKISAWVCECGVRLPVRWPVPANERVSARVCLGVCVTSWGPCLMSDWVARNCQTRLDHQLKSSWDPTTSFLTATTLIYAIGAGITAAAGTRLALQLILDKGFRLFSFQLLDLKKSSIVIYCHYLPVSGLGNLRACCLPWMW